MSASYFTIYNKRSKIPPFTFKKFPYFFYKSVCYCTNRYITFDHVYITIVYELVPSAHVLVHIIFKSTLYSNGVRMLWKLLAHCTDSTYIYLLMFRGLELRGSHL